MASLSVAMAVYTREPMILFSGTEMDVLGPNCGGNSLTGVTFI